MSADVVYAMDDVAYAMQRGRLLLRQDDGKRIAGLPSMNVSWPQWNNR